MTSNDLLNVLGRIVLQSDQGGEDGIYVRVAAENWLTAARICHDDLDLHYFSYLSAMDWLINPDLDGEKVFAVDRSIGGGGDTELQLITDEVIRKAGGGSRFQVMARVSNPESGIAVTLFADLPESLSVESWTPVYRGADWHERETWEMFGITFEGHPSLRHLYLPEDFEGHPLRKDFALLARQVRPWPGLVDMEEMPSEKEPSE